MWEQPRGRRAEHPPTRGQSRGPGTRTAPPPQTPPTEGQRDGRKDVPAVRHTGSSSRKVSPHTTSVAIAAAGRPPSRPSLRATAAPKSARARSRRGSGASPVPSPPRLASAAPPHASRRIPAAAPARGTHTPAPSGLPPPPAFPPSAARSGAERTPTPPRAAQ